MSKKKILETHEKLEKVGTQIRQTLRKKKEKKTKEEKKEKKIKKEKSQNLK